MIFKKQTHELKDAFISYKTLQLSYCQRSLTRLRFVSSVGVHSDFFFLVCMINLCLRWDDRVSHEVSSVPWETAFEPDSLSCSNSMIYGSFLRIDSMFGFGFFFQDFECIEYLLSVETCNFKGCRCEDWEEKVKCWHWQSFSVLALSPLLKGETKVERSIPNYMDLVYNFGGWHKQIQHSKTRLENM